MRLRLTTTNRQLLILYLLFLKKVYKKQISKIVHMPVEKSCLTVLKSPHVHKKAKEQFMIKKYIVLVFFCTPYFNSPLLCFSFLQNIPPMIQAKILACK